MNWLLYTLIKRRSKSCCQRSPTKTLFSKRSQKEKWRQEFRNTTNNTLNIDNACPSLVMLLHFYVEYITPQRLCKFAMTKKITQIFFFSKRVYTSLVHHASFDFLWCKSVLFKNNLFSAQLSLMTYFLSTNSPNFIRHLKRIVSHHFVFAVPELLINMAK